MRLAERREKKGKKEKGKRENKNIEMRIKTWRHSACVYIKNKVKNKIKTPLIMTLARDEHVRHPNPGIWLCLTSAVCDANET